MKDDEKQMLRIMIFLITIIIFVLEISPIFLFLKSILTKKVVVLIVLAKLFYELLMWGHYQLGILENASFIHSLIVFILLIPLMFLKKNLLLSAYIINLTLLLQNVSQSVYERFDGSLVNVITMFVHEDKLAFQVYLISERFIVAGLTFMLAWVLAKVFTRFDVISKLVELPMNKKNMIAGICIIVLTICMLEIGPFLLFDDFRYELWQQLIGNAFYFIIPFLAAWLGTYVSNYLRERQISEQAINYAAELERMNDEMKKFKHYYTNMLAGIQEYIQQGDLEGLKKIHIAMSEHLQEIKFQETDIYNELKNVDSEGLRGVLKNKLAQIKAPTRMTLHIPETIRIVSAKDELRLIRYLGILLDNSIEATFGVQDSFIAVGMVEKNQRIEITVVNNGVVEKDRQALNKGRSSKGEGRGIGLASIQEYFSRKKHGYLQIDIQQNTCQVFMVYPLHK